MISQLLLDNLYRRYNRPEFIHPDPLEFLSRYPDVRDREIVGLIASALAYGRVAQILRSVDIILRKKGRSPYDFVRRSTGHSLTDLFDGFKHRFTTHEHIVSLILDIRKILLKYGSLNECFVAGLKTSDSTLVPALTGFAAHFACCGDHLIPDPARGSACKRLCLYLRWMVRKDAVDPGGWQGISRSRLIIPLDTHMARIGKTWKLTGRRTPDMRMALEITEAFREFSPADPVRYDFALTRFGIRRELSLPELLGPEEREITQR